MFPISIAASKSFDLFDLCIKALTEDISNAMAGISNHVSINPILKTCPVFGVHFTRTAFSIMQGRSG